MARTPKVRHLKHRQYDRIRHSRRLRNWLVVQAARLTTTVQAVFNALHYMTPSEIQNLANVDLPTNSVAPAITGTARVGFTLTTTDGTWAGVPTPTFTRQWYNGSTKIAGATGLTYVPVVGDIGGLIKVKVTATNAGGSSSLDSNITAAVIAA